MAVIKCPHCGQTTTDTMAVCYHCGYEIKAVREADESKKYYDNLTLSEQRKIFNEFIAQDDECARFENFKANLRIFDSVTRYFFFIYIGMMLLVGLLIFAVRGSNGENTLGWGICMISAFALMFLLFLGVGIYTITVRVTKTVTKRTKNEALKLKKWLKDNKQMDIRRSVDELGTMWTNGTVGKTEIYLGVKLK